MTSVTAKKITIALFSGKCVSGVTSVDELVLGLDQNRFDIMFIYLSGYGAETDRTEINGRKVFYLSDKRHVRTFNLLILRKLAGILKEQKIDIIHCQNHKTLLYGTMAAMMARTPVVLAHVHGLNRSRGLRRKLFNLLLFKRANRIISVANKVKDDVLKNNWFLSEDKLFVLENSVDCERFTKVSFSKQQARILLGLPPQAFVFGSIGRLAPTKGFSFLIEAFTKVKQQMPSAQLIFIGDGPLRSELEQQAAKTLCTDSIHFFGHRKNIQELLRALDVFVLSSIAEGMPRTILEVMAAGVPCIATEVGGIPEIINSKDVGVLVRPGDSSALAEAMIDVVKMPPQEIINLVEKAKDRVHRLYSHDVVRKKIGSLYNKVRDDALKSNGFLPEGKPFVLGNSLDHERFASVPAERQEIRTELGLPLNAFVYGTIARFGPYKGHNFLIEAFKKVKDRVSSAHLLLVGEGPVKEQLKQDVAVTGFGQSIHFLGYRNDIPRLLGALDCFVLPSIGSEGMPRVILEAMAAGVPCIATDVGGNSEIINSKDVGVLVRPGDSSALAEAMIGVANMPPQEIINLVEKAKDRIRRFYSHDVVREKLENIYEAEVKHYYAGD